MRKQASKKRPEELLAEAAARLKRNAPGMSLRAVAGKLGVTPSYWSKILRGKKPLTQSLLPRVVKVLGLDSQQVAQLQRAILESIEEERLAPATGVRTSNLEGSSPVENYQNLDRGDFWILSQWFYIPILNLVTLTASRPTADEIARRLGLRPDVVEQALERLQAKGLLRVDAAGQLERTDQKIRFPVDRSFKEVRRYHDSMLQRARAELSRGDTERLYSERLISSVCFVGPKEKLNEARVILEEAMYRVANLMADQPMTDEVFHLGLQLFPLSRRLT